MILVIIALILRRYIHLIIHLIYFGWIEPHPAVPKREYRSMNNYISAFNYNNYVFTHRHVTWQSRFKENDSGAAKLLAVMLRITTHTVMSQGNTD